MTCLCRSEGREARAGDLALASYRNESEVRLAATPVSTGRFDVLFFVASRLVLTRSRRLGYRGRIQTTASHRRSSMNNLKLYVVSPLVLNTLCARVAWAEPAFTAWKQRIILRR